MPPPSARFIPSLAGLAMLAVLLGAHFLGFQETYHAILHAHGILPFRFPFLDTGGNLAAWECARLGVDVIESNPCDVMGRSYNYAPFWMSIAFIPLGNADRIPVGLVLDLLFLLSLPWVTPTRSWSGVALVTVAALSTTVIFALDRANPDLLLYLMLLGALPLLRRGPAWRWFGYALIWLMTAIKYYPAILLALAMRENKRTFAAVAAISVALAALFVGTYAADAARAMARLPQGPPDVLVFAAKNLPIFLGREMLTLLPGLGVGVAVMVTVVVQIFLVIACLRRVRGWMRDTATRHALAGLSEADRIAMAAGALLMAGCFFATQNVVYRGIFLLPVLHGLLCANHAPLQRMAMVAVALMWADGLRILALALPLPDGLTHMAVVVARELAWWWLMAGLIFIVLDFLLTTPMGQAVARRFAAHNSAAHAG